jgi:TP901 family phage tail tape measure protein
MANEYTIKLQAIINEAALITSLNEFSKKYTLQLKANIAKMTEVAAGSANSSGATSATKKLTYESQVAQAALVAQAKAFKDAGNVTKEYSDNLGNLTKVVSNYKNTQGNAEVATVAWSSKTESLNTGLKTTSNQLDIAADKTKNWTDQLQNNIAKVVQWAFATGAIYGTLAKIKEGIQYIVDLNKELTNISIVTGMTQEQTYGLAQQYNRMAKELGGTTLEVARASVEFYRQGKTAAETTELIRQSMMLSKLANMDSATSTEALTATMNGFQLETKDMMEVIDALVAVDNAYATSVKEVSSAMQRSASAASLAGVSWQELVSFITVVSATTRKSAESIGESFKTIFARMSSVAAGKDVDEFGDTINNVEKVLKNYNITLRDSVGLFRPMGDVLDEIGARWEEFTNTQQAQIAGAIAGVRQYTNLIALFDNYSKALDAQTIESESAGLATERYTIYMEGLEAAINKSKAAWEGVWQATIESGSIKWFYDLSTAVGTVIAATGGLVSPLTTVLGLLIAIKSTAIIGGLATLKTALIAAGSALTSIFTGGGLAVAIGTGGIVPLIGVLIVLAGAIYGLASAIPTAEEKIESLKQSVQSAAEELKKTIDESLSMKVLTDSLEKAKIGSDEYYAIMEKIRQLMPDVNGYYDSQGRFVLILADNLSTLNDEYEAGIKNKRDFLELKNQELFNEQMGQAEGLLNPKPSPGRGGINPAIQKNAGEITPYNRDKLESIAEELAITYLGLDAVEKQAAALRMMGTDFGDLVLSKIRELNSVIGETPGLLETVGDSVPAVDFEALAGTTQTLIGETEELNSVMQKQKDGTLTTEDILGLVAAHAEYAQFLSIENGVVSLNTEAIRMNNIAKISAQIATITLLRDNELLTSGISAQTQSLTAQIGVLKALLIVANKPIVATPIKYGGSSGASAEDAYRKALEESYRATIKLKEAEKDRLKALLDAYKKIIDKKKESLKLAKEEVDFERELDKKQRVSADIMAELESIKLDNSEEAAARRMELEQELADNTAEIEEFQADRSYDLQIQALDREYELYKEFIDAQIALIDKLIASIQAMIDALKSAKSASTGGGQSPVLPAPPSTPSNSVGNWVNPPRERGGGNPRLFVAHSGAESGFVGGLKSNEEFAKLMKGELVINKPQMENFMNKSLPQMVSTATNEINFEMPINVNGPLDKTVLPDIEKIVNKAFEKMNSALMNRGYKRAVNQFTS